MPLYTFASNLLIACFLFTLAASGLALAQIIRGPERVEATPSPFSSQGALFAGSALYLIILGALLTLCTGILTYAFIHHDFILEYVASYSDRSLPLFYRITAVWAGQDGSLLFWAWSVGIGGAAFAFAPTYKRMGRETKLWYSLFFYLIMAFFLLLIAVWSNPFSQLDFTPKNGRGLNPLLQNPGMIFHPPLLFLGYGGFVVPGCLALAQSFSGKLFDPPTGTRSEEQWSEATRPFILIAWSLLTAGIILGAWWAYMELGWGGYWAWDPVENASLIPWLIASAYLHTGVIGSRRGKLQRTNVFLMSLTTISAFFATYLVRSGVVQSLHAFGSGSVGLPLLVFIFAFLYITVVAVACTPGGNKARATDKLSHLLTGLVVLLVGAVCWFLFHGIHVTIPALSVDFAVPALEHFPSYLLLALVAVLLVLPFLHLGGPAQSRELEDLTSKEGLLLLVAWLLIAIAIFILIATMWPVILDTLRAFSAYLPAALSAKLPEQPMGLEPAFYNSTCLPLFALLAVLLVFCPFRKWKILDTEGNGFSAKSAALFAALTVAGAVASGLCLYFLLDIQSTGMLLALSLFTGALAALAVRLFSSQTPGNYTHPREFACVLAVALMMALFLALRGITQPVALLAAVCSLAALIGIGLMFTVTPGLFSIRSALAAHGVHAGLLLAVLGVAFSGPYQQQYTLEIGRKQEVAVGNYRLVLNELYEGSSRSGHDGTPNYHFLEAEILVAGQDGGILGKLAPQRRVYANFEKQSYAEVDTIFSLGNEVYATLLGVDKENRATIAFNVNPLVNWLWIGGTIMCLFPFLGIGRIRRKGEGAPDTAAAA